MSNVQINVTLSRLHKVIDRLKEAIAEQTAKVNAVAAATITTSSALVSLERLRLSGVAAVEASAEVELLLALQANLRQLVSATNEKTGISDVMAKQDALTRLLAVKKSLLQVESKVSLDEAAAQLQAYQASPSREYSSSIPVNVLSVEALAAVKEDVRRIQKELYALSDKLAALNATQVPLELPQHLAEKFGLV